MIVASHQPHFFPWLGYLDKMAKADVFLINDIAQLEKHSPMTRNVIVGQNGEETFINVPVINKNYRCLANSEIILSNYSEAAKSLIGKIKTPYRKSPGFAEVWPKIEEVLLDHYERLIDLDMATIHLLRQLYNIDTPMMFHSKLNVDFYTNDKSINIIKKCIAVGASCYLSGNGARKYMDIDLFEQYGITVQFQLFSHPTYHQVNAKGFVSNMSAIDMLFNLGVDGARDVFWSNIKFKPVIEGKGKQL